jgi:hypothetical protein
LTGLPSEIEGIAGRPMMAYAIEGAHGAQAPAGIEAVELVVEHPPDPLNPKRMRLTALSRLEAGERPNLGPLGAATDLDLDIARAFGAGLTVLSLDPALDTDGVIVTRFSAPGSDEEGSASDASATLEQGYALETASAAANLGSDASASVVAPWVHLSETMVPDSGVEPVSDAPSNSLARAIVFDFSMLPGFVGGGPTAHHWNLSMPPAGTFIVILACQKGPQSLDPPFPATIILPRPVPGRSVRLQTPRPSGAGAAPKPSSRGCEGERFHEPPTTGQPSACGRHDDHDRRLQ